jgi:hypothetical protein
MVELFINGTASAVGQLTLYGDEPLSLNISVSDIKDISKRNSTFSQTFTLPADKNNNILLNHIFNIGADSSFDPTKKTQCFILNDGMPVFNGQFQLTKINVKNRNVISYESVVYGETIDLVKSLGDKLIIGNTKPEDDLDFSELDHNRDAQTILNSWSADTEDLGYYYPLIDYGYDLDIRELNDGVLSLPVVEGYASAATLTTLIDTTQSWTTNLYSANYHEYTITIISGMGQGQSRFILSNTAVTITIEGFGWTVIPDTTSIYTINKIDTTNPYSSTGNGLRPSIFKPALSATYLFKKIINDIGFSIDGDFINSDIFTETIIPYNNIDAGLNMEDIRSFQSYLSSTFSHFPSGPFTPANLIDFPFDDDYNRGYDRSNLYNTTTFKYTSPSNGLQAKFYVNLSYNYNLTYLPAGESPIDVFYIRYYRSSVSLTTPYYQEVIPVDRCPGYYFMGPAGTTPPPVGAALSAHEILSQASPQITMLAGEQVFVKIYVNGSTTTLYQIYDEKSCFYNRVYTNGVVDNYIKYNNWVPKNIKQVDYIKSIITMFNLMVIPNKNDPKKITFIPRNEYYATGEVKDWSNKIDHTEKIEETLISEQQSKSIRLTYKEDKDYYNANYKEKVNSIYGEYIKVIDNEWVTGEKKIEVIFSPTPVDKVFGSIDIYLPKISKRDEKTGAYSRTDFNIRFLRKNKNLMPTQDTIKVLGLPSMNSYPYCGHLDHPINPLIDYNFGAVSFVYYEGLSTMTPHNLVYDYWKEYLDDINDKNSKLIKCKIYLTPNDIAQFNYNDSIYIEGLTDDGGHYFNVNKINYTPTSNLPSTIELIKVNRRPDVEAPSIELSGYITLPPVRGLDIGIRNVIEAPGFISGTDNTISNTAGETIIIGGSNNYVSAPGVVLINSNNQTITEPFTTIVGNTYFPQEGDSYTLFNDIDSGLDEVIYPFAKTILNDIDSGLDAVRNIGGQSVISDIDSGVSQ